MYVCMQVCMCVCMYGRNECIGLYVQAVSSLARLLNHLEAESIKKQSLSPGLKQLVQPHILMQIELNGKAKERSTSVSAP